MEERTPEPDASEHAVNVAGGSLVAAVAGFVVGGPILAVAVAAVVPLGSFALGKLAGETGHGRHPAQASPKDHSKQ
jgi:hypothetical protein